MLRYITVRVKKGRLYRATPDGFKFHKDAERVCDAVESLRPVLAGILNLQPQCIRFKVVVG